MLLAANEAVSKTVGLLATFIGIGIIATVVIAMIVIQVRGEHQQNLEHREQPPERKPV